MRKYSVALPSLASEPFMTCYFHFAPQFLHGSGRQMPDKARESRQGVFHLLPSLWFYLVRVYGWQSQSAAFPKLFSRSPGQAVWSAHDQSNMSNRQCFPPTCTTKNLASIIIAPQGELPEFLPSSFVRNEALSLPVII